MKLGSSQKLSLLEAAKHYYQSLPLAEEYLEKRGITSEAARTFRLGVVEDPLPGHENYKDRLVIPYITKTGIIDLRFRAMNHAEPKYLGLPGASTHLYNVLSVFNAIGDWIAICEGEIDTITLDAIGIPALGVPGANNWKRHYSKILQDFDKIYVFADGDQAGADFGRSLARELANVIVIQMPEGEDVNSMYISKGKSYFLDKVNA
jgi:DNA primase